MSKAQQKKGRPKKRTYNPFYPYENEAQMRVAESLKQLQLAYSVAEPELRSEMDTMFDFICDLQDKIEEKLEKEYAPTSLAALNDEKKAAEEASASEVTEEEENESTEGEAEAEGVVPS